MTLPDSLQEITPEPLTVLYRDEFLICIDKPSGLLVHRSEIDRHETRFAIQLLRDQIGARVYPLHRLDKPTSGVLCFALSPEIARELSARWGDFSKTYLGVVRGVLEGEGTWDKPLKEPWDKYGDRQVNPDKDAQTAVTHYRGLAACELPYRVDRYPTSRYSLVEFTLEQGRRHQIRRHCKSFAHPIVGDSTYGKARHNKLFADLYGAERLLLHAAQLELIHPVTGLPLSIKAPLTGSFCQVVKTLGWDQSIDSDLVPAGLV